jgi:hypothetical protein
MLGVWGCFRALRWLSLSVVLAGCADKPVAVGPAEQRTGKYGIDLAMDASDVLNQLKASPVGFVARYYRSPASRWPALSASEAQRLSSLGVNIVAVWEWHSHDPAYFSYGAGYNDALTAYAQAQKLGQPPGSAIYFAVDFDAQGEALASVTDYFRGVAAGLAAQGGGTSPYKVGVYGSGAVCDTVRRAGLAQYSWLSNSTAWTGSSGYNAWNIRQTGRLAGLSFDHDADEAKGDYGGFRLTDYQIASPYAAASSDVAAAPAAPAAPAASSAPAGPAPDQWVTALRNALAL